MKEPTAEALERAYGPARRSKVQREALAALWQGCRERWPDVYVAPAAFMGRLAEVAGDGLAEVRATELYLAQACLAGDAVALAAFEATLVDPVSRAVAKLDSSEHFVAEVKQRLRERLLVGRSPRLAQYEGKGSLAGWVKVAAVRLAIDVQREQSAGQAGDDGDRALERLSHRGPGVELEFVRKKHRADFTAAFQETLAALDPRSRTVLRLAHVDGSSIDAISVLYGTHRATAARWLVAAREALVAGTRARLQRRLRLSGSELESLLGALQSQLDVSVSRLLEAEGPPR